MNKKDVKFNSIYDFFKTQEKERHDNGADDTGSKGKNFPYSLSKGDNLGTLVVRIIPDTVGRPTNILYNVREPWVPVLDEDGTLSDDKVTQWQFPAISNWEDYEELPDEAKKLYKQINKTLDDINEYLDRPISFRKEIVYFYGKPLVYTYEGSDDPVDDFSQKVRLFRSHSRTFSSSLAKSIISKKKSLNQTSFLEKFFNRNVEPSKNMVVITTSNKEDGFGFDTSVTFESDVDGSVALSKEDLEFCKDLSVVETDLTKFDIEFWKNRLEVLKKWLVKLDMEWKESGEEDAVDYEEDEPEFGEEEDASDVDTSEGEESDEIDEESDEVEEVSEEDDEDEHL